MYGAEILEVVERLQHDMATSPAGKRAPCTKGMKFLKAVEHLGSWDVEPALVRKERELPKVDEGKQVLKRQRLDIEKRFELANAAAQWFEASWRDSRSAPLHRLLRMAQNSRV